MRPTAQCFTIFLLAMSSFIPHTAAKVIAMPGAAQDADPYPAATPYPLSTPKAAPTAEILEAHRELKRFRTTYGGCYSCNPPPTPTYCRHCGGGYHSHHRYRPHQSYYTTTTFYGYYRPTSTYEYYQPSPTYGYYHPSPTYGYYQHTPTYRHHHAGGGHGGRTTTIERTVFSGTTTVFETPGPTTPAVVAAGAICTTLFAQGNGLPITTQGSCGLIVIKQGVAGRVVPARGAGFLCALALGWAVVMLYV